MQVVRELLVTGTNKKSQENLLVFAVATVKDHNITCGRQ